MSVAFLGVKSGGPWWLFRDVCDEIARKALDERWPREPGYNCFDEMNCFILSPKLCARCPEPMIVASLTIATQTCHTCRESVFGSVPF